MAVGTRDRSLTWRGDDAYERTRQGMLFNQLVPDRRPDVIASPASAEDVAQAVELARARGMKVAVRSGGHSFCGSPLRERGMLIDLSHLRELSIDSGSRTATLEPAVTSRELARALAGHGLGFPVAHHGAVPLGGYLLCGGFGWNMGCWGPACFSVKRVEVVTADGELVTADEDTNADLLWAARGSGPGFFGVATRFQLDVHPMPGAIRTSTYLYPLDSIAEIGRWAADVVPGLPPQVETLIGLTPKAAVINSTAFADSDDEARSELSSLESCPVLGRAIDRRVAEPASVDALQDTIEALLPHRHRYVADTLWSNHDLPALLPTVAEHVARAPSPKSLVLAVRVPAPPPDARLPDAAFSMVARTILLFYAIWEDPNQDEPNRRWLHDTVASVEPLGVGHYIAEADLPAASTRATRSFAPPNWDQLEALRAQRDPDHVFHTYLGLGADAHEGA